MKRISIYILLASLLSLLPSCLQDDIDLPDRNFEFGSVTLDVKLMLPEPPTVSTRAAGDGLLENIPDSPTKEQLDNLKLYLLVFEDEGSPESNTLQTLLSDDEIQSENAEDDTEHIGQMCKKFNVTLDGTHEDAIIHIIAAAPDSKIDEQINKLNDPSEADLFYGENALFTSGNNDAYWKRIVLNSPISPTYQESIQQFFNHVKLVRNYARVNLELETYDEELKEQKLLGFELDGFILVNVANSGYVAAYNPATRSFIDFETGEGKAKTYEELIGQNSRFEGTLHPQANLIHRDDQPDWISGFNNWNTNAKYSFERPYQKQNRTFVLVKGRMPGKNNEYSDRYIKLDIGTINTTAIQGGLGVFETYHLLRNISYNMKITEIRSKNVGHPTALEALVAPPANNVGTSVETSGLLSIYDEEDHLQVNFTTIYIVDDDTDEGNPYPSEVNLMWRYFRDYQTSNTLSNEMIKWDYPGYELTAPDDTGVIAAWGNGNGYWSDGGMPGAGSYELYTSDTDADKGNKWAGFRLKFNKPDDTPREKTVRLYCPGGLSRDIRFVLRKRWEFVNNDKNLYPSNIEVYPGYYSTENNTMKGSLKEMRDWIGLQPHKTEGQFIDGQWDIGSQRGARLTVAFELPDDLPQEIFPLDFKIGADRQNIENAPAGNAVVTSGPSLFDYDNNGVGAVRTQFIKTVTWKEYLNSRTYSGHHIITARFQTTTDPMILGEVDENSITRVRVANRYFVTGEAAFHRNSFEDVIDPTQTEWSWNFGEAEWEKLLTSQNDSFLSNHCMNNMHFYSTYSTGKIDITGSSDDVKNDDWKTYRDAGCSRYIKIGDGSSQMPSLKFPVRFDVEYLKGAILQVQATPDQPRSGAGTNLNPYNWYDRDIHVGLIVVTPDGEEKYVTLNTSAQCNQNSGSLPLRTLSFDFTNLNTEGGKYVKEVLIWSVKTVNSENNTQQNPGATRYFSVKLSLPQNIEVNR